MVILGRFGLFSFRQKLGLVPKAPFHPRNMRRAGKGTPSSLAALPKAGRDPLREEFGSCYPRAWDWSREPMGAEAGGIKQTLKPLGVSSLSLLLLSPDLVPFRQHLQGELLCPSCATL